MDSIHANDQAIRSEVVGGTKKQMMMIKNRDWLVRRSIIRSSDVARGAGGAVCEGSPEASDGLLWLATYKTTITYETQHQIAPPARNGTIMVMCVSSNPDQDRRRKAEYSFLPSLRDSAGEGGCRHIKAR